MRRTLCLDLGTNMGYSIIEDNVIVEYGNRSFKFKDEKARPGKRYRAFSNFLGAINKASPINEIVYEDVKAHKGVLAAHIYGGFRGLMLAYCEFAGKRCRPVGVGKIKKHATGKGNAGKPAMIDAANNILLLKTDRLRQTTDDNEADAICLADYVIEN